MKTQSWSVMLVLLVLGLGWWQQDMIKHWFKPQPAEETMTTPPATQTELYSWVDKDGTTHYSDAAHVKGAKKVIVDTAKITPLKPPVVLKPATTTEDKQQQQSQPIQTHGLHELAIEMQQAQKKLKEAKEQQTLNQ